MLSKAIEDEKQNPWKAAIIDELVVDCILAKEHESDPEGALRAAIDWNVQVALDPAVSAQARDMLKKARMEALLQACEEAGPMWALDEIHRMVKENGSE